MNFPIFNKRKACILNTFEYGEQYKKKSGSSIINRCTSCIARGTPFKIISRELKGSCFILRHLACRQLQDEYTISYWTKFNNMII